MSARILLLALGAFAVGTSAYIVAGVLPAVAAELGVSVTAAGQLATVFALTYAVSAPLLATFTGRWDRRTVLLTALLVGAAGNGIAALATTYPLLMVGRVVAALGAAAYTPAATVVAAQFAAPERRGRTVAVVIAGLTFALVIGVPAGTLLVGPLGYRGVFGVVALGCLLAGLAVRAFLPTVAGPPAVGLRARLAVAADRRVLVMLAVMVLAVLSTMTVYTYVVPLLEASTGETGPVVGGLLVIFGLGALLGNWLGGRATDRYGSRRTLTVSMIAFVLVVAVLPLAATTVVGAGIVLLAWGVSTWCFNPPVQHLLLELAPAGGGLVLSLNASAIYLAVGLSGVVGAVVINLLGVLALPLVAAVLAALATALFLVSQRRPAGAGRPAPAPVASGG